MPKLSDITLNAVLDSAAKTSRFRHYGFFDNNYRAFIEEVRTDYRYIQAICAIDCEPFKPYWEMYKATYRSRAFEMISSVIGEIKQLEDKLFDEDGTPCVKTLVDMRIAADNYQRELPELWQRRIDEIILGYTEAFMDYFKEHNSV